MGYAMPTQIAHGIHFRQWSRAFIIADSEKKSRVVFVNVDICMGTQIQKMEVGCSPKPDHCSCAAIIGFRLAYLHSNYCLWYNVPGEKKIASEEQWASM